MKAIYIVMADDMVFILMDMRMDRATKLLEPVVHNLCFQTTCLYTSRS